jgi:hypothetical protein
VNDPLVEESFSREWFLNKFDDSDTIIILPDGGFLHGEATVSSNSNPQKIIAHYNSQTDQTAVKVGSLKKVLSENGTISLLGVNLSQDKVQGANVPSETMTLGYGAEYSSNSFSGSGWRFEGYFFKAINSPLPNLIWSSHVDSGLVGTRTQANYTHNNGKQELYDNTFVNIGARPAVSGTRVYYSFSPKDGTYYYVGNVDAK